MDQQPPALQAVWIRSVDHFRRHHGPRGGQEEAPRRKDPGILLLILNRYANHLETPLHETAVELLLSDKMGHDAIWFSRPRKYGQGSRHCRACSNKHGLIRSVWVTQRVSFEKSILIPEQPGLALKKIGSFFSGIRIRIHGTFVYIMIRIW